VRVERDEALYPSKGTWPQYRGRTGTITVINRTRPGSPEYGVVFGKVRKPHATFGSTAMGDETWFKSHELTPAKDANNK